MFAVKGRSWRSVSAQMELAQGETRYATLPADLLVQNDLERNEGIRMGIGVWIDSIAQGNGYDNAVSCASYASSTMAKHKAEAVSIIAWRDAVWAAAYALLAAPPAGVTTLQQVIALLPKPETFGWVKDAPLNVSA